MLRLVAHVRADVSEELSASIITATRIGELGTRRGLVLSKRWFLQEPHAVTSQKSQFFGREIVFQCSDIRPDDVGTYLD
jgi:hypothetical protein